MANQRNFIDQNLTVSVIWISAVQFGENRAETLLLAARSLYILHLVLLSALGVM